MSPKHLVLLGGGHSHIEVLRQLGQRRRQQHGAAAATALEPQRVPQQPPSQSPPSPQQPQQREAWVAGTGAAAAAAASGHDGRLSTPPKAAGAVSVAPSPPPPPLPPPSPPPAAPRVTLLSRGRFTPYSGMLPGWAAGHYSYGDCHVDLRQLVSYAGAELVEAEATGLDAEARRVLFGDGSPPLSYDVLSIDIGITPGRAAVPGAEDAGAVTPVKPIDGFAVRYEQLLERYRSAAKAAAADGAKGATDAFAETGAPLLRVVVVGGGAGGVELAAAVRYRLEAERRAGGWPEGRNRVEVSLVCRGGLLPGHPPHVRRLVGRLLTQRGVRVLSGDEAVSVSPGELLLRSGARLPYDECLWCTAATPAAWLRTSGLPTDAAGFLLINEQLQSDGGPQEVFAAGDVATCAAHPRPKAGVYAVRQGPPLAANLRAFQEGGPLRRFVPQSTALALISLGDRFAVASRTGTFDQSGGKRSKRNGSEAAASGDDGDDNGGDGPEWPLGWLLNGCGGALAALSGPLLWRWKDSIDRTFMRRYGEGLGD